MSDRSGATSAERLEECARRLEAGRHLNAFAEVALEPAHERARVADGGRPLDGVPFAVKELFDVAGLEVTCGSAVLAGHRATGTAAAVAALEGAGAIVVGMTRTHEFAWGMTGINQHYGPVRNPHDPDRIAGGSSSGSAAAVAFGIVPFALGTDTGGSVRIPAALCGIVGFKPTYDLVSTDGVFPLAPTLDHVGVLARSVDDVALVLGTLVPDATYAPVPARLRIGLADADLLPDAARQGAQAIADEVRAVAWPSGAEAAATFGAVQRGEALAVHRRRGLFPARAAGYGADVRARLERSAAEGPDVRVAGAVERERIRAAALRTLVDHDVVVAPICPVATPRIADVDEAADDRLRAAILAHTAVASLAGLPACAVPTGVGADGMPVGVQVIGAPGADRTVLMAANRLFGHFGLPPLPA